MFSCLSRFSKFNKFIQFRTFLSDSYKCTDVWQNRKTNEVFQKIDYDDLYYQLERSFQIGQRINILDVDLFVNGLHGPTYINELEDVLFKLRLNPETGLMEDRTMHAVVRYYMEINEKEKCLEILSNRINYGIFLNYFMANMLMDDFLKENNSVGAVKIAVLQMLQEDFNNGILKPLCLYSCFKYLNSKQVWELPKEPEVDPEEEEVKVRVSFIRNAYFDDHFDLMDPNHLVGKTLYMLGKNYKNPIGLSSQLIGLTLWEKFSDLENTLKTLKEPVYKESIEKCIEFINNNPNVDKDKLLEILKETKNCLPGSLEDIAKIEVENSVKNYEKSDIDQIKQLYKQWELDRIEDIKEEQLEEKKRNLRTEMSNVKQELEKEEQELFYFDKENEWDLAVESIKEKQQQFEDYQSQFKKKKDEVKEYIPPDIIRKRSSS